MTVEQTKEYTKPSISTRGREVQGSPIRKLASVAEARKKTGITVYHLNIGQPDLPSPEVIETFLHQINRRTIEYAPSNGMSEILAAWKTYFAHHDIFFDENEMIVTTGGSEGLLFALNAVCDSGDEVLVFEPFYTNYNGFASLANVKLTPIELHIDNKFALPTKEEIEKHITPRTKGMLFCNPSNPTGRIFTPEELHRLATIAIEHNLFMISDEVYREFSYDRQPESIAHLAEVKDRTILVDSCSKRFNVCGARVGVLATKNQEVYDAVLKFSMARLSVATIEQLAMVPLLQEPERYTKPIVEEFHRRRDAVYESLGTLNGVTYYKPEGAFYIVVGLPVEDAEHFSRWMIEEFEDNNETVLLAPAAGFYATPGKGKNEVRIAFMLTAPNLIRSISLIGIALEQYRKLYP